MKKNNSELEKDSNEKAWEYYQKLYKNSFIEINENSTKIENSRIIKIGKIKYKNKKKDNIKFSGDCFFNFNDKKISVFKKVFCDFKSKNNEVIDSDTILKELENVKKFHHNNENLILLPVSGGLNNVKGKCYICEDKIKIVGVGRPPKNVYDRPDTFVCLIDDFYKNKNKINNIKSAGEYFTYSIFKESLKSENFLPLYETLDLFNNVYEFCECFFGIGDGEKVNKLIDKMLKNGRNDILDCNSLKNYIDLAYEFWSMRENYEKRLKIKN